MKNTCFTLFITVVLFNGCISDQLNTYQNPLQEFSDSLFQANLDSAYIAGASVLIYQHGKLLLDRAYGYANLELEVRMPGNASFEIGSVTKQFTAAAILKLAEEGKLSLEDDLTSYLDFDTRDRRVSIRSLLNHTSGIPGYTELAEFEDIMIQDLDRDTLLRMVEQHDFLFEPGTALIYNNSAFFFLGLIIEKVTGMSYEKYLEVTFFEPLGMHQTYYSSNTEVIRNRAFGYDYSDSGLVQKQYIDYTWPYAAGSLSSSAEDLLVWMQALHGGELFDDQTYRLMITPDHLNDGSELRYAMGIFNYMNFGHREIGHGGGIPGFLSETKYFPGEDLYIICLVNTAGPKGANFFAEELTWKILNREEYDPVELDIDPQMLSGVYSGPVRGRSQSVEVTGLDNSLILSFNDLENTDTLNIYIGNHTWIDGNTTFRFDNKEMHIDQVYEHYVLKREQQ